MPITLFMSFECGVTFFLFILVEGISMTYEWFVLVCGCDRNLRIFSTDFSILHCDS